MNLTQPQAIPTDEEVQKHIDMLQVQISDKEAEIVRQGTIITSNKYTIQQLANEKAELESKLVDRRDELNLLLDETRTAEARLEAAKTAAESILKSSKAMNDEVTAKVDKVLTEEKNITQQRGELASERGQLEIDRAKLNSDRAILDEKLAKLKSTLGEVS